ncbi:DUF2058 family protein [Stenotrophomonas sp.]|uniref:DUF2058 domain-containing protein n=1 Tax=Stenotrophomonas sp. TaxID=69392 RepID=UPI0028B00C01|nr:DUF2058 family protein [Stenotrophomonas sp.]
MSDTLRDQLLGLGFKSAPKPERTPDARRDGRPPNKPHGARPPAKAEGARPPRDGQRPARDGDARRGPPGKGRPGGAARPGQGQNPGQGKPRSREDIDLAKAYAIRAQKEKDDRIEAERLKQEEARLRREAKAKLDVLLEGKSLNDAGAEIARHFNYGGKIKRIYVTADQLKALNAGELGVLQQNGRYMLVTAAVLDEAEAIFAPSVALRVDPNAPAEDDPYADPAYQVPDDLVW